jgi:hypothetical protein
VSDVLHNLDKTFDLSDVSLRFNCNTFQAASFFRGCNKLRTIAVCNRNIPCPVFRGRTIYRSGQWTATLIYLLLSSKTPLLFRVFIYFSLVFLLFSSTLCFTEQLVVTISANGEYVRLLLPSKPVTNNINQHMELFTYI